MIYPVCSIHDDKTGFYPVSVEQSLPAAIRNFAMMINNGEGLAGYYPVDFQFYHVADFDSEKGVVVPVTPIEQIATGLGVFHEK